MTETSGSGSDESTTPSEGVVGAIAGSIDDAVAKEATPKKRVVEVVTVEKAATIEDATNMAAADRTTVD
jgi:hypothetical protein